MLKYPTSEKIIESNKKVVRDIKVKKADKFGVLNKVKIDNVVSLCKAKDNVYGKASCLLKGIIQEHPFESANRRTAFVVMEDFLKENKKPLKVENSGKQAKVLQGIREGYYSDQEIKNWLKKGEIRGFKR